jgi:uncharacterized protein YacL
MNDDLLSTQDSSLAIQRQTLLSEPDEVQEYKPMWQERLTVVIVALSTGLQVFPNLAMYYFFKDDLNLNLTQLIFYNSLLNFVWVLKPLFGFCCDSYKFLGSHRISYLVFFSVLNAAGWLVMAFWVSNLLTAMLTKTVINVALAFVGVVGEAIMVEIGGTKQETTTNVSLYLSVTSAAAIGS